MSGGGERPQLGDHAGARLERRRLAVERQQVAAQEDARGEPLLERAQHRVVFARKPGREVVRQLELTSHALASAARTCSETRLPSARPATSAITIPITVPRSLAELAPDCATARATISASCGVVELGRQIGGDDRRLGGLAVGELVTAAVAEGSLGLAAALALAAQHRELVAGALLGGLLQLRQQQPQRADALSLAGLHRDDEVALDGLGDAHLRTGYARPQRLRAAAQTSPRRAGGSARACHGAVRTPPRPRRPARAAGRRRSAARARQARRSASSSSSGAQQVGDDRRRRRQLVASQVEQRALDLHAVGHGVGARGFDRLGLVVDGD